MKNKVAIKIDNKYFAGSNSVCLHTSDISKAIKFNDPYKAERCKKYLLKKFNILLSSYDVKVVNL